MTAVATLALTTALVGITAWYAKRTSDMVEEIQRSREAEAEPKLVLDLQGVGPMVVFPALVNVGVGPGLNVDAALTFFDAAGVQIDSRRWRTGLVMPGERRRFFPPDDDTGHVPSIDSLAARVAQIRLSGQVMDRLGRTHVLDYGIDNLREWRDLLTGAKEEFLIPTDEKIASEVTKLRERLERLNRVLEQGLHIRTDEDLEKERDERQQQLDALRQNLQPSVEVAQDVARRFLRATSLIRLQHRLITWVKHRRQPS